MTNEDVIDELLLVWEAKKFKIVNIKQYIVLKNFVVNYYNLKNIIFSNIFQDQIITFDEILQ